MKDKKLMIVHKFTYIYWAHSGSNYNSINKSRVALFTVRLVRLRERENEDRRGHVAPVAPPVAPVICVRKRRGEARRVLSPERRGRRADAISFVRK